METSVTCLDRKRKLQAEPLGLPPSKHACGSESFDLEYGKQGDTDHVIAEADYSEAESGNDSKQGDTDHVIAKADYSEAESGNGSNSISTDTDSSMATSCDAETGESSQSKEYTSELQSVSPRQRCSNSSSFGLCSDINITTDHDLSVHLPLNIEEHVREFGCHVDGCCLECNASVKGLEEFLYAREVVGETSVLASGELTVVDADVERNTKLTIDKEFENYFSALML